MTDYPLEMTPHLAAESFYNGEIENEMRELGKIEQRFLKIADREECMEMIEEMRLGATYPHPSDSCTADCKRRSMHTCACNRWSKLYTPCVEFCDVNISGTCERFCSFYCEINQTGR